jgi:hypothetical protein
LAVNAFIPTLIAVLLAEVGGRMTLFARLSRLSLAATLLGLAVGTAAFAGISLAPTMNANARALMLGIALILTGFGQFGKAPTGDPPATPIGTLLFVWRSGAPFLAFAFSIWKSAPVGAVAGALAGIVGAVAVAALPLTAVQIVWLRRSAGSILIVTGVYAALWALHLIA